MTTVQLYDITGVVTSCRTFAKNKSYIGVETELGVISCLCEYFKPAKKGDTIMGTVTIVDIERKSFKFVKTPYVSISNNEQYIHQCFSTALKKGYHYTCNLYSVIVKSISVAEGLSGIPCFGETPDSEVGPDLGESEIKEPEVEDLSESEKVVNYLSDLARKHCEDKDKTSIGCLVTAEFGITEADVKTLFEWWYKQHSTRKLFLLGLTRKEIKACHMSHDRIYEICTGVDGIPANPFRIAAIPMLTAHSICDMLGVMPHPEHILCGEICRKVRDYSSMNAWTCTPMWMMRKAFPNFQAYVKALEDYYFCKSDMDSIYLMYPYIVEKKVAYTISKLIKRTAVKVNESKAINIPSIPPSFINKHIKMSTGQMEAIHGALEHDICIITGGPGTGKSTICKEIVDNLSYRETPYLIGSFTGKAVARLNESTGKDDAKTLDSMIMRLDPEYFYHLIIDEASMVTTELFFRLDRVLKKGYKLTIIGDIDQLQPIGWGSFMSQLMVCDNIPIYRLMHNFRINGPIVEGKEAEELKDASKALINANNLIDKSRSLARPYAFQQGQGFTVMDGNLTALTGLIEMYKSLIDSQESLDEFDPKKITLDNIMVICPFNVYCDEINKIFANTFHADDPKQLDHKKVVWQKGFRVMMNNNNYDINVMNGQEGNVTVVTSQYIEVEFSDGMPHKFMFVPKETNYGEAKEPVSNDIPKAKNDINVLSTEDLNQSYCITVHKSQGSERDHVFVYIPRKIDGSGRVQRFLNINILYTALTRCRKEVFLVGDLDTIKVITTQVQQKRCDNLATRIKALSDEKLEAYLREEIIKVTKKAEAANPKKEVTPPVAYDEEYDPFDEEDEEGGCFLPVGLFI